MSAHAVLRCDGPHHQEVSVSALAPTPQAALRTQARIHGWKSKRIRIVPDDGRKPFSITVDLCAVCVAEGYLKQLKSARPATTEGKTDGTENTD